MGEAYEEEVGPDQGHNSVSSQRLSNWWMARVGPVLFAWQRLHSSELEPTCLECARPVPLQHGT